jgi:hypothetical protein
MMFAASITPAAFNCPRMRNTSMLSWGAAITTKTTLADSSSLGLEVKYLQLTFSVSADEEHVHLQMSCGGKTLDMGVARTITCS